VITPRTKFRGKQWLPLSGKMRKKWQRACHRYLRLCCHKLQKLRLKSKIPGSSPPLGYVLDNDILSLDINNCDYRAGCFLLYLWLASCSSWSPLGTKSRNKLGTGINSYWHHSWKMHLSPPFCLDPVAFLVEKWIRGANVRHPCLLLSGGLCPIKGMQKEWDWKFGNSD
jgi:hypothetical protein